MSNASPGKRPAEAWRSASLFEAGIGHVVVARFKGNGDAELGAFLLDVFCLGVKNAFFTRLVAAEYAHTLKRIFFETEPPVPMTPSCARHLVEEAIGYARRWGLSPHEDYKLGCRVFGGIDASACTETFTFGRDGKPSYVQGPNDSRRFTEHVLQSLVRTCGQGNFTYAIIG
jgi:hypothetical protein